jgi:hypothetical protein
MNRFARGLKNISGIGWLAQRFGVLGILIMVLAWGSGMPSMALAADSGTVCGFIRDGEGKALAGASVTLTSHSEASGISHATSGPTGEYRFSGLSDGEYSVGAEMAGYAAAGGRTVQVTAESNTATVDLVLIRTSAKAGSALFAAIVATTSPGWESSSASN